MVVTISHKNGAVVEFAMCCIALYLTILYGAVTDSSFGHDIRSGATSPSVSAYPGVRRQFGVQS